MKRLYGGDISNGQELVPVYIQTDAKEALHKFQVE